MKVKFNPTGTKPNKSSAGYMNYLDTRFGSLNFQGIGISLEGEYTLEDIATDALESGSKQKWIDMLQAGNIDLYTLYDSGVHLFFTEKEARDWNTADGDKVYEIYKNGIKLVV